MTFFFYISYEPKHHFVVYKITLHILTQKNYIIKNRVMSATEHYFAKMSVNDTK